MVEKRLSIILQGKLGELLRCPNPSRESEKTDILPDFSKMKNEANYASGIFLVLLEVSIL
jgi:hypothetical protein